MEEAPRLGPPEWGTVVTHYRWGCEVRLDKSGDTGLIDRIFLHDNLIYVNDEYWPAVGERVRVRRQVVMPDGQLRLTRRQSDLELDC